jgi:hypothetical protein
MEAEELRIALEATRTVEYYDIEGRALAEQLQHIEEYAASPAETYPHGPQSWDPRPFPIAHWACYP